MAVNVFPAPVEAAPEALRYPVVLKNITAGTTYQLSKTFIPKGNYASHIVTTGTTSGLTFTGTDVANTLHLISAKTGRPTILALPGSKTMLPNTDIISIAEDSYVQSVRVNGTGTCNLILTPTTSLFSGMPGITGNRTTTASTSTSSTSLDIDFGTAFFGWDYDRDEVFIITATQSSSQVRTYWRRIPPNLSIYRYNTSTQTWDSKQWTSISAGTGSQPDGQGLYISEDRAPQFFIKNNFLHNLVTTEMWRDASGNSWGWVKTDLTTSGTTLTLEAGHSNTSSFSIINTGLSGSTTRHMMYFWDKKLDKVIFTGARNTSGTITSSWNSRWVQWDIATNTLDYNNINSSTADPTVAGDNNFTLSTIYSVGIPDAETGFIYGIGVNGSGAYLAKFNRTGTRTNIGGIDFYEQYNPAIRSGVGSSYIPSWNKLELLPYNLLYWQGGTNSAVVMKDYTESSTPISALYGNSDSVYTNLFVTFWGSITLSASKVTGFIKPNKGVYILSASYVFYGAYALAPINIMKAPISREVVMSLLPGGGIPTKNTTDSRPGNNIGDGN